MKKSSWPVLAIPENMDDDVSFDYERHAGKDPTFERPTKAIKTKSFCQATRYTSSPSLQTDLSVVKANLDQLFLLVMGGIVLFMQLGFALLEASAVRTKNVTNIFVKNVTDMFFGNSWFSEDKNIHRILNIRTGSIALP